MKIVIIKQFLIFLLSSKFGVSSILNKDQQKALELAQPYLISPSENAKLMEQKKENTPYERKLGLSFEDNTPGFGLMEDPADVIVAADREENRRALKERMSSRKGRRRRKLFMGGNKDEMLKIQMELNSLR